MLDVHESLREEPRAPVLGEAVLCNGVDSSALRRAHMRELTMARQAAERRYARPLPRTGLDRREQLQASHERATELRAELARIDTEHRSWLEAQGTEVPEMRAPRAKAAIPPQP